MVHLFDSSFIDRFELIIYTPCQQNYHITELEEKYRMKEYDGQIGNVLKYIIE